MKGQKQSKRKKLPRASGEEIEIVIGTIPLQCPASRPSNEFLPYLERALRGDLDALVEFYCNASTPSEPAFFECLGQLVVRGGGKIIRRIMNKQMWTGKELKAQVYAGLRETKTQMFGRRSSSASVGPLREVYRGGLMPVAEKAACWIKARKKQNGNLLTNREQLWRDYVNESKSLTQCSSEERGILTDGHWLNSDKPVSHERYLQFGIVPRQLFLLLAQTRPKSLAPSEAVRQYMSKPPLKMSW